MSFLSKVRAALGRVRAQQDSVPAADSAAQKDPLLTPGQYDDRPKDERVLRDIAALEERNLHSSDPVVDPSSPLIVSMATYTPRLERVFLALESIGRGDVLPGRLVLALDQSDADRPLPETLQRLVARGLEIISLPDGLRSHKKYWGIVRTRNDHEVPLVVADDDQLYPVHWLSALARRAVEYPECVVAHRAHQIPVTSDGAIAPYRSWTPFVGRGPSFAAFPTGVSGTLFPPALLRALHERGEMFLEVAAHADDVWLHSNAVDLGIQIVQVEVASANFDFVPGTQQVGLYFENVFEDANDSQILRCYSAQALERIANDPFVGEQSSSTV